MARSRSGGRLPVVSARRSTRVYGAFAGSEMPPGASRDVDGQACTHCGATTGLRITARLMVCLPGHGCQRPTR